MPALMEQVGNMTIRLGDGRSRREVRKPGWGGALVGRRRALGEHDCDQMRFQTLHNFRSMCRVLNLILNNAALQLCVLLMSRCSSARRRRGEQGGAGRARRGGPNGLAVGGCGEDADEHDARLVPHAHYLELAPTEGPAQESEVQEQAMKAIAASMRHAGWSSLMLPP